MLFNKEKYVIEAIMKIVGLLIGLTILFEAVMGFNLPQKQLQGASSKSCGRQQADSSSYGNGYSDGDHSDRMSSGSGNEKGSSSRIEKSGGRSGHK